MLMTAQERRLLALLLLFLGAGHAIAALRACGVLPAAGGGNPAPIVSSPPAPAHRTGEAWPEGAPKDGADESRDRLSTLPAEELFHAGRLDLNRADSSALTALPGIGPALAHRILVYRRHHGGFVRIAELTAVKGIGPHRLAQLEPYLTLPPSPVRDGPTRGD